MQSVVFRFLQTKSVLFIALIAITTSCSTTKRLQKSVTPTASMETLKPISASKLMRNVRNAESCYETYGARKASISATLNGSKNTFTASIKAKMDSVIIISAQKGILPIGKLLATEDTLILVNYLGREIMRSNYERLEENIGVNLSLFKLEDLLMGNALTLQINPNGRMLKKYKSFTEDGYYVLTSLKQTVSRKEKHNKRKKKVVIKKENKIYIGQNKVEERLYFDPHTFKLSKVIYKDLESNSSTTINIDKYVELEGFLYPSVVTMTSQKQENIIFELKVKLYKMWVDKESSFKFSIPSSYKSKVL
ncbi:DUF4292 domain-containing protein [Halosquirtibacter xylanolyticus]|uniref:DUF4292 domain-containing protein n=1 Tax=Halosquirtibacter xylanolyticus TaxID=3374599 RepID=UPI00374A490E|nr:DUF4292 domain-containing protein [Prolixibacteraceae bacterium]